MSNVLMDAKTQLNLSLVKSEVLVSEFQRSKKYSLNLAFGGPFCSECENSTFSREPVALQDPGVTHTFPLGEACFPAIALLRDNMQAPCRNCADIGSNE